MKILELLKRKTKETLINKDETEIIGDGKAEFLGVGTYEEYENEQKEEQSWLEWAKEQLKTSR